MSVIMYRLKKNGRAAVVVPDGFLFGLDNAKVSIKKKLLKYVNCFIKVLNNFQSEELNDIIDAAAEKLFDKTGQRFWRRAFSTARLSFLTVLTLQPILYFLKTFPPIITVLIFISLSTISKSAS